MTAITPQIRRRPGRQVLRLLPVGMATMVAVDVALGERAEYFDAAGLVRAWLSVLRGAGLDGHTFVMGQERLGDVGALAVGSTLFVVEPAIVLAVLVVGGGALVRALGRLRAR